MSQGPLRDPPAAKNTSAHSAPRSPAPHAKRPPAPSGGTNIQQKLGNAREPVARAPKSPSSGLRLAEVWKHHQTGLAVLTGVFALVAFFALRGPQPAWDGPHIGLGWDHVLKASSAVNSDEVLHVSSGSKPILVNEIRFGERDLDAAKTKEIRTALVAGNVDAADAALRNALTLPAISDATTKGNRSKANQEMTAQIGASTPAPILPAIAAVLHESIKSDNIRYFSTHVYDPCAEDGDIVCLFIGEQPYILVPLTRAGCRISIPIERGSATSVRLVGIRDGGGGITVAYKTGTGTFICRSFKPGTELPMNFAAESEW